MSGMRQVPLTCHGHTRPITQLAFSGLKSDGSCYLITASKDSTAMLLNGITGDWWGTFSEHKGAVWACKISTDCTIAATGSADFTAKIFSAETGQCISNIPHSHIVRSVDLSDNLLLTGSYEKLVKIFDLNKPESGPIAKGEGHTQGVRHALFTHDGSRAISTSGDKSIKFWETASMKEIKSIELEAVPNSIEISPDGKILSVCYESLVSFWEVDSMTMIKEIKVPTHVLSSSLHPSGDTFVCGGEDFQLYKYNYSDGTLLESFKGHFGAVHCVRFSPDGEVYASGSEDGTVRYWQTEVGKTYGLWRCIPAAADAQVPNGGDEIDSAVDDITKE